MPFAAALVTFFANARELPECSCDSHEDNFLYNYPARLKWAFGSLHDGFDFSPYHDSDSNLTSGNVETIIDGLHFNARLNGISMPMNPGASQNYGEVYDQVYCHARSS